ncbi:MAG: sensor domain-containing diguanylate cyclase [Polyangia bacterium]
MVDFDVKARLDNLAVATVASPAGAGPSAIPQSQLAEEMSIPNPVVEPGPIQTLSAEEITRFFVRSRRDPDPERWDVRLDATLREILERANDFVPSEAGGILLDDPRATLAGVRTPRLTFIASYGPDSGRLLGKRVPSDRGLAGQIYRSGMPYRSDHLEPDDPLLMLTGRAASSTPVSVIGVPVLVGEAICGVLELTNRRSGSPYSARDHELLRIFAAYMSSSIQNALDALRARAMARLDHLTGLFNSRYFHVRLQDEIAHADHNATDLSLLFIDLDHFKLVNDRFGHIAGSWTLREVARLLSENSPPATVLARYGGDEFVAILPGADLQRAVQSAELLRHVIETSSFFDSDTEAVERATPLPGVRASIGVASYRDHLAPSGNRRRRENLLLRLADTAMYHAKANGRNRVEVAEAED